MNWLGSHTDLPEAHFYRTGVYQRRAGLYARQERALALARGIFPGYDRPAFCRQSEIDEHIALLNSSTTTRVSLPLISCKPLDNLSIESVLREDGTLLIVEEVRSDEKKRFFDLSALRRLPLLRHLCVTMQGKRFVRPSPVGDPFGRLGKTFGEHGV
jgi:hypothetical protein